MQAKKQKKILIVSDGKRGHLHQTTGVAGKLSGTVSRRLDISVNKPYYLFLVLMSVLARRFRFSQALILYWLQRVTATPLVGLVKYQPDVVLSAGSLTHPVTFLLGRLWGCPTVVCMTPSLLSPRDFSLVVAPRHDAHRCRGDNVIYTMGAASNISEAFIFAEAVALRSRLKGDIKNPLGLLVGGDSALNYFTPDMATELAREILLVCEENDLSLLATTSRRTPLAAEQSLTAEISEHDRCRYLLLASQSDENPVPAIIGLCDIVVVTEDSVSMVSEIISGGKHAVVVQIGRRKKRNKFITLFRDLAAEGYITYTTIEKFNSSLVNALAFNVQGHKPLDESLKVATEIQRRFLSGGPGSGVKK